MRTTPLLVIAVVAASMGLWNGHVERWSQAAAEAVPASFAPGPSVASPSLQVESGTPLRVRLSGASTRGLRTGVVWAGRIAGPVVMLRADLLPAGAVQPGGRSQVVFEEVTIPALTPVTGVVTSARAIPDQGTLLNVTVRTRDARGRALALLATAGPVPAGPAPELRFTVRQIVEIE